MRLWWRSARPKVYSSRKPHLGTDRLVRILRNAREYLIANGVEIRFGTTVEAVALEDCTKDAGFGEDATGRRRANDGERRKVLNVSDER